MKKLLAPFCLLFLLAACGQQAETESNSKSDAPAQAHANSDVKAQAEAKPSIDLTSENWSTKLSGSLDDKIMIDLDLARQGNLLKGTLTYKSQGKPIRVFGHVYSPNSFFIREYAKGTEVSGMLSGEFKSSEIEGSWSPPSGDKTRKMVLQLAEGKSAAKFGGQPGNVAGKYSFVYPNEGGAGNLNVKQTGNKLEFDVSSHTGAPGYRMAIIEEAEAELEGNSAICRYVPGECEFKLTFFDDFAFIDWIDDKFECEFGMGASIEGIFVKE